MELTREYFEQYLNKVLEEKLANYPTKDDLIAALEPLATKQDVRGAVEELVLFVAETVANPMEERFQLVDQRFEQIDLRFEKVEQRFEQMELRFEHIENRFDQVEERFQHMDIRFQEIDIRLVKIDGRIDGLETGGVWKPKVEKLEGDMNKIKNALYLS